MTTKEGVLRPAPAGKLQDTFIGWQCRVRQLAMRNDAGRPSPAMTPRVSLTDGTTLVERMVTLIVPHQPYESTEFFKHQVRKSNDRREVMEKGLTFLQSTHFQMSTGFRDELTAMFSADSPVAAQIIHAEEVLLDFAQFSQAYRLPCRTRRLDPETSSYAATLWHNRLFNPQIPDSVTIVSLLPDWDRGLMAEPG
ncbi:MAG: hypothetical protein AAGJ70_01735 [Pseudomonadota bacterium]